MSSPPSAGPESPDFPRIPRPRLVVAAGLVWLGRDRVIVQRRAADAAHGGGMLEFPGGKVEPGESVPQALRRELLEEWGPAAGSLRVGRVADILHHVYPPPGPEVLLCVYHVDASAWLGTAWHEALALEPGVGVEDHEVRALPLSEFLAADRPFAAAIARGEVSPRGG